MHDDWGSQKDCFCSPAVYEATLVPAMRMVTDHIHSIGKICEFHSCGNIIKQVPNIIKAGWDVWVGQTINDYKTIYDNYGDQIVLGIQPPAYDKENITEEEERALAREFADYYCRPDKPTLLHYDAYMNVSPVFMEELYKQSRINYSK